MPWMFMCPPLCASLREKTVIHGRLFREQRPLKMATGTSRVFPHEFHEDLLQRVLVRAQVLEADAGRGQVTQQRGDAGALTLRVVGVGELVALAVEFQSV